MTSTLLAFSSTLPPQPKSFRIRTCKSVSKQRTLIAFTINTYKKHKEGVVVIVNLRVPATSSSAPRERQSPIGVFSLLIRQNPFRATSFLAASCKIRRVPPVTIRQFPNRCAASALASTLSYLVASWLRHFIASYLPLPLCTQAHSLFPGARQFNGKL